MSEIVGEPGKDKRKAQKKKWVYKGSNPTTLKKYFELEKVSVQEPIDNSGPEDPASETQPAQQPTIPQKGVDYGEEGPYWNK